VIVLPERIDAQLLRWLEECPLQTVIVVHANHPNEIDHDVATALQRLKGTGATLLNQAVLLQGVNDEVSILAALSERLFEAQVLPYYLHQLDRVEGARHFEVSENRAKELLHELRTRLPGYLVPSLVREQAGKLSKTPL
jgi:KamA family protein